MSRQTVEKYLSTIQDPYLGLDLLSANALQAVNEHDGCVSIDLLLGYPCQQYHAALARSLNARFSCQVNITTNITAKTLFSSLHPHPEIKNVIAVASGKGGVGKSTTTINLAAALMRDGARVGILDADIYGPNVPQMLGDHRPARVSENKQFDPVVCYGMQAMSIGYLVNAKTPMVWRGPMVSGALLQLFNDTHWSALDYLLIDLPPGTGDIQLTLAKKIPVTAAVVVTTPQDVALLDAHKAYEMFKKVSVPVFGLIENMATHTCSQCGHEEAIFGQHGVHQLAEKEGLLLLGSLPLAMRIREQADRGTPIVISDPDSAIAQAYIDIARTLTARLSLQADYNRVESPA